MTKTIVKASFPVPSKYLKKTNLYIPGSHKLKNINRPIILSANENSRGTSPEVLERLKRLPSDLHFYPSDNNNNLRASIAKRHNIPANNVICGAGSNEILNFVVNAYCSEGDHTISSNYGFLMYSKMTYHAGATPIKVNDINLKTSVDDVLKKITNKTKIIFIANPNNPTGSYINKEEMDYFVSSIPKDVILVLDSAYEEYASVVSDYPLNIEYAKKYTNVLVTKTFSKIYGLAGLRVGWGYAHENIILNLHKSRPPFNLSVISEILAISALESTDFVNESIKDNVKVREFFCSNLQGFKLPPSIANFQLVGFSNDDIARKAHIQLAKDGIIVREMNSYKLNNYLRITIGTMSEMKKVVGVLNQLKIK